ncbi:hypothetical protein M7784_10200 [Desulfovibrio aminophilus]|nr:hypothetical protein [Desulfovibrio aminophilus]MCM0755615.1 hypothetical protein [Desulfovibrio aminophilus]
MDVDLDFRADFKDYLLAQFTKQGYQIPQEKPLQEIAYLYFNFQRRSIPLCPRAILESSEFHCPSEHAVGYLALKEKLITGQNANPYLSKRLRDVHYNDPLLNDWGIHHFHLGTDLDQSGFVERTKKLLFAFVTNHKVYCINIYDHLSWCNKDIMNVLYNNWPDLFEHKIIKGISPSVFDDDEYISTFRKSGIMSPIRFGNSMYAPLGGGLTTAKTSVRATLYANRYISVIKNFEKFIKDNIDYISNKILESGLTLSAPLKFVLYINHIGFFAHELGSNVAFRLCNHEDIK